MGVRYTNHRNCSPISKKNLMPADIPMLGSMGRVSFASMQYMDLSVCSLDAGSPLSGQLIDRKEEDLCPG